MRPDKRVRVLNPFITQIVKKSFTQTELDIFFFLLGKLTKSHSDETVYTLNLEELAEFAGHKYRIDNFVEAARQLRRKEIYINDDKRILVDGLLSSAEFIKGKRLVEITISNKIKPFLIDITYNFTSPQLFSLIRLKSIYAKKIYLFFTHPERKPKKGITRTSFTYLIEEFKQDLGLINELTGQELFTRINDLKKRVLEPAKLQINKWSNIKVQYKLIKVGREFIYITWEIERQNNKYLLPAYDQPRQLISPESSFTTNIKNLSLKLRLVEDFKVSEHLADITVRRADPKMINDLLAQISQNYKDNKVKKDIGAYTAGIIKHTWGFR